ncbi:hypothetical protein HJC99_02560 [Candidatus Saccharibacteria bacterium]|nr:hypothetical protein [Candidatus Saccharibacteria bacterium]
MLATNPAAIGPVGVTVWFVLLLSVFASVLTLAMYAVKAYFHLHATRQQRLRYSLRQGLLVAGWVSGLLALASLGQLGVRDVILLGLAAVIVELYVRFRWP